MSNKIDDVTMIRLLEQRWGMLTHPIFLDGHFENIVKAYDEPHRHYHTIDHLFNVMWVFDTVRHLVDDPIHIQIALFYHDIVYNPSLLHNEYHSYELMTSAFTKVISDSTISTIRNLIKATRIDFTPQTRDQKWISDIDLSILGSHPNIYREYSYNVRKEYSMFPDDQYNKGRKEVLLGFLNRDHIYSTSVMRNRYEQLAIENIADEIERLSV